MEKLGITREDANLAAIERGVELKEECFQVVKSNRGRPKKKITEDVCSSDEEKPKKKRGRPRKEERVVKHEEETADLLNKLVVEKKKEVEDELTESVNTLGGIEKCDELGMVSTVHNHLHGENTTNVQ